MNQIKFGNPGGMPVTQNDFDFLQKAVMQAIAGLASATPFQANNAVGYILSGCAMTLQAGIYHGTPGFVYIFSLNEIFYYAGGSTGSGNLANLTWVINDVATTPDPVTFANQVSRNIHRTRTITLSPNNSNLAFNSTFTYMGALLNALSAVTWININVYAANWNGNLRYCRDAMGFVHIQGIATPAIGAGLVVATLPLGQGLVPDRDTQFNCNKNMGGYPNITAGYAFIRANGDIEVSDGQPTAQHLLTLPPWLGVN